jgi:hypothetical protein
MKKSALQEKFEMALKKGLESESVALQTAAIKATADMLNPALGELTTKLKQAEDRLDEAKSSLKEITTERDTLAAKVVELQPLADKAGELDTLRAENETWKADARKELVSMAQQERFKAEATLRAAEEKLHTAENTVASSGWTELRSTLADLISRYSVPMPDFWSTSSDTMPSAFWTLWGWSPAKAKIFTAYKASYKSATESFKAQAYKILTSSGLPSFPIFQRQSEDGSQQLEYAPQVEIPDLGVRRECLLEMAQRFGCDREIQERVQRRQTEILGQHLRQNATSLEAQQISMSQRGYGRQQQEQPEESLTGVPISEHLEGCLGKCCAGRGVRLPNSMDEVSE